MRAKTPMAHLQASGWLSQTKFEINHIEITPCPAVTDPRHMEYGCNTRIMTLEKFLDEVPELHFAIPAPRIPTSDQKQ